MLCGVCLALTAAQVAPRLVARPTRIAFEMPDITVAVEGAVREPGRYTLAFGANVGDLVAAAGGLNDGAAAALVNVADPLTAGERVVVPLAQTAAGEERIDVNAASVADLQRLPGIGPVTAGRIAAGRPYGSIDDLLGVRGIGPKTLERLRPLVGL